MERNSHVLRDLMTQYGQDIMYFIRFYTRSADEVEDMTQEVFLRAFRHLHEFRNQSHVKTWLLKIAVNVCRDDFRHRQRRPVTYMAVVPERGASESAEQVWTQRDEADRLVLAVQSLPDKYRQIILLYYFHELDLKEISWTLNLSETAVKSRLHRARLMLREREEANWT